MPKPPRQQPGHRPRKRFGQNFLQDPGIIQQIVAAIHPTSSDTLVEIGPGQGAITSQLVDQAGKLAVIELDRDLIPELKIQFASRDNLTIIAADALSVDYGALAAELGAQQLRLVGNLPYNISTPLLFHLLTFRTAIDDMYFMLQKEVVDRMAAHPGDRSYGRLSIMLQFYCSVEALFEVPPEAFYPAPKVDSAVVRLVPHQELPVTVKDPKRLQEIVTQAFSQRRKTVKNALKSIASEELLLQAGIQSNARPEEVSISEYAALTNLLPSDLSGAKQ